MTEHTNGGGGDPRTSSNAVKIAWIFSFTLIALAVLAVLYKGCGIIGGNTPGGLAKSGAAVLSALLDNLSEHRRINVAVGAFFKESKQKKLQFKQRDVALHFKIVRWRNGLKKEQMTGPATLVDRADIKGVLGQRAIAEASGNFEITFYIDLANQNEWRYEWNKTTRTLRIIAPPFAKPYVGCNTPALTTPLTVKTIEDCVSFDEDETKRLLKKEIPRLKKLAAMLQVPGVREDARRSLEEFFGNLLPKMVGAPADIENDVRVDVLFRDEMKRGSKTENKRL